MKNFVVYKAGAGSGKTFTLVKEYLRLALFDPARLEQNYRHILAITFTNKAAAEMKNRIVASLDRISSGETSSAMAKELCRELATNETELRRRASAVLTHLLHHYSDFSVGTIDSFTHRIVRTFAQELQLPVNFNVELDAAGFYERVISQLLSEVGEDPEVSKQLREFVLTRTADNSGWDPEQGMRKFTELLLQENAKYYLEKLSSLAPGQLEKLQEEFRVYISSYREHLRSVAQEALDLIKSHGLQDDDFHYKKQGPQNFFYKCVKGDVTLEDAGKKRLATAIADRKWLSTGNQQTLTSQFSDIAGGLVDFIARNYSRYSLSLILSKQMHLLMLLRRIDEISRQQKEEERIVFISEFNTRIFDLINSEPAPFIYERLGERYHHFLLDEFQDTSSLQWLNLLPLLDNSFGSGWYNLIVGDGKQSIYRWRNANVNQFAILPQLETGDNPLQRDRALALERNFEGRSLRVNYRSARTLVDFNNDLFAQLALVAENGEPHIYSGHAQEPSNDRQGYITIQTGGCESEEIDEINFAFTLQYIRQALGDGFHYKDICVLCRYNWQGNQIASQLVVDDIPVVSSDSLLLKNNLEVNTVISYLRAILNPKDHVSAAAVVAYLHTCGSINSSRLDTCLKDLSAGKPLREILRETTPTPSSREEAASLAGHCLSIISRLQLEKRAGQYIRFLLDEVHDFMVSKSPGIGAFLEWWESRKERASLVLPADTDAVRIMTIHASKGLEFPVVIVPYCNWQVYRSGDAWVNVPHDDIALPVGVVRLSEKAAEAGFMAEVEKEKSEQLLDNVNLLYVAFTRAESRMHIICSRSRGNTAKLAADWISDYVQTKFGSREDGFYEIGSRKKTDGHDNGAPANILMLDALSFDDAMSAVQVKQSTASAPAAITNGIILHDLLAQVEVHDDIDRVIATSRVAGTLAPEALETYRAAMRGIVEHPQLRLYFEQGVKTKNESELMTAEGELLRPDKVVFMKDHVAVIDYKTGAERVAHHTKQLQRYAQQLNLMGHNAIKKLLVYIDENRVVEVN